MFSSHEDKLLHICCTWGSNWYRSWSVVPLWRTLMSFFIRPLLWCFSVRSQRKHPLPDLLKSVSVSCSSKSCKLIIHHSDLGGINSITDVLQGRRVSDGTEQWTTFNTRSDWLAARCQYGRLEIWIQQVGSEYGCDQSSDYI